MKIQTAIAFLGATLISSSMAAQSSDHARILALSPNDVPSSTSVIVPAGSIGIAIPSGGGTAWLMTVRIDDLAYSFYPRENRKVHLRDFIVGDDIRARIEKDRVYVTLADGRETHGKLLRRQRLQPETASAPMVSKPQ